MDTFYYAADGSVVDLHLNREHMLVSAATLWKKNTFSLPTTLRNAASIFIDSGGFSFPNGYPYTLEEYAHFIKRLSRTYPQINYAAVIDYPFHPKKTDPEWWHQTYVDTVSEIKSYRSIIDPVEFVHVLHGHTLDDYIDSIRYINLIDGFYANLTAVGSLKRFPITTCRKILHAIREYLGDDHRIHAFGLPLTYIRNREIFSLIDSSDSGAWRFSNEKGNWKPKTHKDKIRNYHTYHTKINALLTQKPTITLADYTPQPIEESF